MKLCSYHFNSIPINFYNWKIFSAAYLLTKTIDSDVRPCDDFYAYACGTLLRESEIPEGWDTVNSTVSVVAMMTVTLIRTIILAC